MKRELREALEQASWITATSQWRTVKEKLCHLPCYKKLDSYETLTIFDDYIQYLEAKALEKARMKKETSKKTARQVRTEFRGLLGELHSSGKIQRYMGWTSVEEIIENEPILQELVDTGGYDNIYITL